MATHAQSVSYSNRSSGWLALLDRAVTRGPGEPVRLAVLLALTIGLFAVIVRFPDEVPRETFTSLIILAGLALSVPRLVAYFGVVLGCVAVSWVLAPATAWRGVIVVGTLSLTMGAMFMLARSREGLGVYGTGGERLLRDLRRRHRQLGEMPALPAGWYAECAIAGAHGDAFLGDLVLSAEGYHPHHAEFCVADISGKGLRAGTRAMTVAAAFSGLLGQVEPADFLDAANSYLVRQRWAEGFATAAHLDLDPTLGRFSVSCAGHPPVMRYCGDSGAWIEVSTARGPALGLMEHLSFPQTTGELRPGDALVVFTDGVIESRDSELADGIDWVGGVAERYLRAGSFAGLAGSAWRAARGGDGDDRAALVIWRR